METIQNNILSIIGMTGCGKTSVGRALARTLGARFIDIDTEIRVKYGDIPALFAERGEEGFRRIEYELLRACIESADGKLTILSCGGGLPTFEPSRLLLCAQTTVIWIRRSAEIVTANPRVLARPPINGSASNYRCIAGHRYPIYRKIAKYSFYNFYPLRTARAIIRHLRLLPAKPTSLQKKGTEK